MKLRVWDIGWIGLASQTLREGSSLGVSDIKPPYSPDILMPLMLASTTEVFSGRAEVKTDRDLKSATCLPAGMLSLRNHRHILRVYGLGFLAEGKFSPRMERANAKGHGN